MSSRRPAGLVRSQVLLTCEHASAAVPRWADTLVKDHVTPAAQREWRRALLDHRGWDPGAHQVMRLLQRRLGCPALAGHATRLLVDLNRSAKHPKRFSSFTRRWPDAARAVLHRRLWWPHWQRVSEVLRACSHTVHFALHSFDPTLAPGRHTIDVGLLYDPRRPQERAVANALARQLRLRAPDLRVRRNQPYLGIADGLPTAIRKRVAGTKYQGLEVEISQALVHSPHWLPIAQRIADALAACVQHNP